MRRYDIVTGILLVLSIIDFALPAPVLVQEERRARDDEGHILKDVISVLEKRWGEELEMPEIETYFFKTSGERVSSKPPATNTAPSTANSESEPSCWGHCFATTIDTLKFIFSPDFQPVRGAGGYAYGGYRKVPVTDAPQPEGQWVHPSADPNFNWRYWMNAKDPPPFSGPPIATVREKGETSGHATADPEFPLDDQSLGAGYQPPDPQAAALYAAKGKAKVSSRSSDTARDTRKTAGNAAQGELQPAGRSLDRGE